MPKVSVIIPVYNGREYLSDCFASLEKQSVRPNQVIVVDNNSGDDSRNFLNNIKIDEVEIKLIYNQINRGFVGACNQGLEVAMQSGADYIFLLNQDTVCEVDCLKQLLLAQQQNKHIFAIQAILLCWPQTKLIQTSGDRIHFLGFGYSGDFKQPVSVYKGVQKQDITYASGAAMFINVTALRRVGLFDEDLFMYHDDLDLCWRARFLGYQIILAPQAVVYHKYKEGTVASRWYWSERNRTLTLLKFYKWPTLVLIFLPWLIMELGVLLYSLLTGWFLLKIKSYFSAIKLLPKTIKKRKIIQNNRVISDREITKLLEAKFSFSGLNMPFLKYVVNPIFNIYWIVVRKIIVW